MIKSMTGYGRAVATINGREFTVELRSVNNRYLDCTVKLPRALSFAEDAVKQAVKASVSRGKVDVYISYEDLSENKTSLKYNRELAGEYLAYFQLMEEQYGVENDVTVSRLMRCPEVLTMEENKADEEALWKLLQKAVDGACEKFVESRIAEGEHLKNDLSAKLSAMQVIVEAIAVRSPEVFEEYRVNIRNQVEELLGNTQIDESRIATEIVLFADKMCVDEELVRLRSHIEKMKNDLQTGEDVGRKLDFLAQEMNREANTILSKANDLEVTNKGIDLKTEIEKVREQIQNLE